MAEPNFILAGRVLDENNAVLGYWGISLALGCVYVYSASEMPAVAKKIAVNAKFDPRLDYIKGKPNDYIFRLSCNDQADLLFTQKGTFTVIPNTAQIKHSRIISITPDYKYIFSSGFSVGSIRDMLATQSTLLYGDTVSIFTSGVTNAPILDSYVSQNRKRLIVATRKGSEAPVVIPYGITKVVLDGYFKGVRIPETVELIEGPCNIETLVVNSTYFPTNTLKIACRLDNRNLPCIKTLRALNVNTLVLDEDVTYEDLTCGGEVIAMPTVDKLKTTPKLHINASKNFCKPLGEIAAP